MNSLKNITITSIFTFLAVVFLGSAIVAHATEAVVDPNPTVTAVSNSAEGGTTLIPSSQGSNSPEGGTTLIPTLQGSNDEGSPAPISTPVDNTGGVSSNFSGGSSSGGSSSGIALANAGAPALFSTTSCPLITTYMRMGSLSNNSSEVAKLQSFLKNSEGLSVNVTGNFDQNTENAVKAFQQKYLSDIMGPWDADQTSGFVYITTSKKINELACEKPFLISSSDQSVIDAYKAEKIAGTVGTTTGNIVGENSQLGPQIGSNTSNTNNNVAAVGATNIFERFWNFIKSIFSR